MNTTRSWPGVQLFDARVYGELEGGLADWCSLLHSKAKI